MLINTSELEAFFDSSVIKRIPDIKIKEYTQNIDFLQSGSVYRIPLQNLPENCSIYVGGDVGSGGWVKVNKDLNAVYPGGVALGSSWKKKEFSGAIVKKEWAVIFKALVEDFNNKLEEFFSNKEVVRLGIRYIRFLVPTYELLVPHPEATKKVCSLALEGLLYPIVIIRKFNRKQFFTR